MPPSTSALEGEREMLRIEKDCHGRVTRLLLSGRIQSDHIASVQAAMRDCCERKILDLSEVTLVDLKVVRFLVQPRSSEFHARRWNIRSDGWASTDTGRSDPPPR